MKQNNSFNFLQYLKLNVNIGILISLILWIYLVLRAFLVPFLHDEIMTYWFYINTGHFLPFSFKIDANAANNHLLNSLLSRFLYLLFGYTPIVLRMANLLFVPVYCYFSYKIADTLKNKNLALLFWLCLLFIHTIVEFMALCRGYGMSFALLFACLWYLIKVFQTGKAVNYFLCLLFLNASIAANLSLITTALIISVWMIIITFLFDDTAFKKTYKLAIILFTGLLPISFFAVYSFVLQKSGALYYGTHNGFWSQSVASLMKSLFDNQSFILRFFIIIYFALILAMLAKYIFKHFFLKILQHEVLIFPFLLTGNIIGVMLLDLFFNVNFPEDRSGFYFYYFFIGSIFFLIDKLAICFNYKRIAYLSIPFLIIPLHFIFVANLSHIAVYKEDRVPYRFYEKIKEKSSATPEIVTLGSYFGRTLVLAYQNYLSKGNIGKSHDTDYPSIVADFQVVKTEEFAKWKLYYNTIDYDKVSGYHLLERKHKLNRKLITEIQVNPTNGNTADEFFNFSSGSIDTLKNSSLFFEYTMDIESQAKPFEAWIVVSVTDSLDEKTAYEYIPLNWFQTEWKTASTHFHNGQLLTNISPSSKKYITYLWNINKVPFSIKNAKVCIKQLDKD
ncbi:MAG: hypothetical protein WCO13_01380 [Bacteroidota bacterium]